MYSVDIKRMKFHTIPATAKMKPQANQNVLPRKFHSFGSDFSFYFSFTPAVECGFNIRTKYNVAVIAMH